MKRQRGRGRKPGHHHQPNRTMESNGPDMKVRGPAPVIYEKYLQLARDAHSAGDRIQAENYQQHAEHYFRLLRAMQPAAPPPQADRFAQDFDYEGEEESAERAEGESAGDAKGYESGDQPSEVRGEADGQTFEPEPQGQGFRGNRRRGRRNRFRPEGDQYRNDGFDRRENRDGDNSRRESREGDNSRGESRDGDQSEMREGREDFEGPRRDRFERGPRDRNDRRERRDRGEEGPSEGFAGQTPAFLSSD